MPSATPPLRIAVNSPTLLAASSSARRLSAACSAKAWPASVGTTPRPARTNRSAPSARSSLRTCSATAGCDTRRASAAALNEPSSSAAQKQRTCWRDRSSAFDSAKQSTLAWRTPLADHARHERTRRGRDRRRDRRAVGGVALRHRDVLLLEAEDRLGGRLRSDPRGDYWLNYGAHLFPAPGTLVDSMARDCGLETVPVTGSMMGLAVGLDAAQPRARRDLSLPAPAVGARAGRVRDRRAEGPARGASDTSGSTRPAPGETPADVRARVLAFEDDRTFADFLGDLPPAVEAIFSCAARRATAEPSELSAGCGIGLFALVWGGKGTLIARNLRGGTGRLPAALGAELGDRARTGCRVSGLRPDGDELLVDYGRRRTHRPRAPRDRRGAGSVRRAARRPGRPRGRRGAGAADLRRLPQRRGRDERDHADAVGRRLRDGDPGPGVRHVHQPGPRAAPRGRAPPRRQPDAVHRRSARPPR